MTNKEIGQRIEDRRRELDYTLDYIASKIGVAKSTIQRYEKGQIQKIKLPVIKSIAGVLCVDPNWIIGKTEDPTPQKTEPTADDGFSENKKALIEFAKSVPEDKAARMLQVMQLILASDE